MCGKSTLSHTDLCQFADTTLRGWIPNAFPAGDALHVHVLQSPFPASSTPCLLPLPLLFTLRKRQQGLSPEDMARLLNRDLTTTMVHLFVHQESLCFLNPLASAVHGTSQEASSCWSLSYVAASVLSLCVGRGHPQHPHRARAAAVLSLPQAQQYGWEEVLKEPNRGEETLTRLRGLHILSSCSSKDPQRSWLYHSLLTLHEVRICLTVSVKWWVKWWAAAWVLTNSMRQEFKQNLKKHRRSYTANLFFHYNEDKEKVWFK